MDLNDLTITVDKCLKSQIIKNQELIIDEKQIHFKEKTTNDELYKELIENGWKIQNFPGCTADWNNYKKYEKKQN